MKITLREEQEGIDPDTLKVGQRLLVSNITWVKKKNNKWRCIAFNVKDRLCRIYKYRPPLCLLFQCTNARKHRSFVIPVNVPSTPANDPTWKLTFNYSERN